MRATAAIILLAGLPLWWWAGSGTSVIAGNGEQQKIYLPGLSEVVLNAGSELRYFELEWKKERRIILEGEAYFKVTKGVPFLVETKNGTVEVLGTQFNIYKYDRENVFKTICYEVSVRVVSENAGMETVLKKGEGVEVNRKNYITFKEKNNVLDWTTSVSVFSKTPLSKVFAEMERQYDLHIDCLNVNLQREYVGEFPHGDLEEALEVVCGAMDLKYDIKENGKKVEIRTAD